MLLPVCQAFNVCRVEGGRDISAFIPTSTLSNQLELGQAMMISCFSSVLTLYFSRHLLQLSLSLRQPIELIYCHMGVCYLFFTCA